MILAVPVDDWGDGPNNPCLAGARMRFFFEISRRSNSAMRARTRGSIVGAACGIGHPLREVAERAIHWPPEVIAYTAVARHLSFVLTCSVISSTVSTPSIAGRVDKLGLHRL